MRKLLPIILFALVGCSSNKPVTKGITDLKEIEGRWYILQIVGPDGKGYECNDVYIDIKDGVATQFVAGKDQQGQTQQLRLEFNADKSAVKLYTKTDANEKLAGEVIITVTTADPVQMLWADRNNSSQETLMEKVDPQ